jgi:hypothetical protein
MSLRDRLMAGMRAASFPWAEDLAVLYGLRPGESLVVTVVRPAEGSELVVDVARQTAAAPRNDRPA